MYCNGKYVTYIEDCGENTGGYYCIVYKDETLEEELDNFCIDKDCIKINPDVEYWIKKYFSA